MNYAVVYQSKTGNTKKVAEEIYWSLNSDEKCLINLSERKEIPVSDVYLVCFGVHNRNCGMDVIDSLEQIENGKIALFATCGFTPAERYKVKLENSMMVWMPDNAEYLGMFLCQGEVDSGQRDKFVNEMPERADQLYEMFENGIGHPDREDLNNAVRFVRELEKKVERDNYIHIM